VVGNLPIYKQDGTCHNLLVILIPPKCAQAVPLGGVALQLCSSKSTQSQMQMGGCLAHSPRYAIQFYQPSLWQNMLATRHVFASVAVISSL